MATGSLDPLTSLDDDRLNRQGIVEALEHAVQSDAGGSLVLGLNGSWGSGKTTILNALEGRLATGGTVVVRLDAWNYREPSRLVEAYVKAVEARMGELAPGGGGRGSVQAIGQALATLTGGGWSFIGRMLSATKRDALEGAREQLREQIRALPTRIVVFLDDLDRLDQGELQAVLRLVRVVSESTVTHVLAYDRVQLSKTLFPDDSEGTRARDYLAKIVKLEVPVPVPADEAALALLEEALEPVLKDLQKEVQEEFARRFRLAPATTILRALGTPREIYRVAAATAWSWGRMSRDLNLFDLFLLTILQYRFPHVYGRMTEQPEWFIQIQWSSNMRWGLYRERIEEQRAEYYEALASDPNRGGPILQQILVALLPSIAGDNHLEPLPDEQKSRKGRRLAHPDVFYRYFQSALSPSAVPEASIEDFAKSLVGMEKGEPRVDSIVERLELEVRETRIRSFLDQFHLLHSIISDAGEEDLKKDVIRGLSRAADLIPGDEGEWLSPRTTVERWVMRMIGELESMEAATEIAQEVVSSTSSDGLAGTLVFYSAWAEEKHRRDAFGERVPDGPRVRTALDSRLQELKESGEPLVCGASKDRLVNVVFRASPSVTQSIVADEVHTCPKELLRILGLLVSVRVYQDDPLDFSVFRSSLDDSVEHIGVPLFQELLALEMPTPISPVGVAVLQTAQTWLERKLEKESLE